MRRFVQTRDVLAFVREFHRNLSAYYESMSHIAEKNRVKMLLNYLGGHEQHLESSIEEFEEHASPSLLASWFQFMPKDFPPDCFDEDTFEPTMAVDDVVSMALQFDDCLLKLYTVMAAEAELAEVKELFVALVKMEEGEARTLARDTLWLKDI